MMNKNANMAEKTEIIIAVIFVISLIGFSVWETSFFADDLGFDFAGYAVRYNNAFSGWVKNHHFGLPASTFDGFFPSFLPATLKILGLGNFTEPLAISIFITRLLMIIALFLFAREYNVRKSTAFMIASFIAINPITFKFFNRYYELFGWVMFIFATIFLFRYFKGKDTKKSLVLGLLFSAFTVLSHPLPSFFLPVFILFSMQPSKKEIKKLAVFVLLLTGILFFWIGPFFGYLEFASIQNFDGSVIRTPGIIVSSLLLIIILFLASVLAKKTGIKEKNKREIQLLYFTTALAVIQFLFPSAPILNKVLAHSYNFFYITVLALFFFVFIKQDKISEIPKKYITAGIAVLVIIVLLSTPKLVSYYSLIEPRFSTYELNKNPVDFSEIDEQLKKISENERFAVMPLDPIIYGYSAVHYDLSSAYGWGYNAVALFESNSKGLDLDSLNTKDCTEFTEKSKEYGVNKWLALDKNSFSILSGCNWVPSEEQAPSLFSPPNNQTFSLIENGQLIQYENNKIIIKANPPKTLLKVNYFPRWKAYSEGKEITLKMDEKNKFMVIPTEKEKIVELKYEKGFIDYFSYFVSLLFFGMLFFIVKKKPFS